MGCMSCRKEEIVAEVKKQLWLAVPLIVVSLLQISLTVISFMFVGHLGKLALAGASMATSFAGVSGFSLLIGMGSALDTFCGQAYGAKQNRLVGIHMQRAIFILLLASIPLAFMLAYTGPILILFRQQRDIAAEAGIYVPSLFAFGILQCLTKFLQTQSNVYPMMICSSVTTLLHIVLCWIFVFKLHLGSKGPALALGMAYWFNVLLLVAYIKFSPSCKRTWTGSSKEALHNSMRFLKLAVASACMVCLESWSFELLVLLSGLLPNPELETSAMSISLSTSTILFMIAFAIGNAISTRVSNELGSGQPEAAKLAIYVALFLTILKGLVVSLVVILVRNIWGYAYSSEKEVVKYVSILMPLVAISTFLDGIQCVFSGTTRGCGRQKVGVFINLSAYFLVGVPFSALLAFVFHLGGKGLWIGTIAALSTQSLLLLTVTLRTNWEQEASKARNSVDESRAPPMQHDAPQHQRLPESFIDDKSREIHKKQLILTSGS